MVRHKYDLRLIEFYEERVIGNCLLYGNFHQASPVLDLYKFKDPLFNEVYMIGKKLPIINIEDITDDEFDQHRLREIIHLPILDYNLTYDLLRLYELRIYENVKMRLLEKKSEEPVTATKVEAINVCLEEMEKKDFDVISSIQPFLAYLADHNINIPKLKDITTTLVKIGLKWKLAYDVLIARNNLMKIENKQYNDY